MSIVIRLARQSDVSAMLAIYTPYVENTTISWEYTTPSTDDFSARLREKTQAGFPWIVAEEKGVLLGYAYAGRFAQRKGYDWCAETTVYVDVAAHGKHVGQRLYQALLCLLRAQGFVTVYALITYPNAASAAFHKKLGFAEEARLAHTGFKLGQWLGLSYYSKTLCEIPENPVPTLRVDALPKKILSMAFSS